MKRPDTINVTPDPRILRVLGDIEFEPWQCIAELVDNAFDDFLEIQRASVAWPDGFNVSVSIPGPTTSLATAEVVLTDSGRGMSLDTLNNAVRAGWSGNDRFSKLGLFGMGFNIATARLGRVVEVLTATPDSPDWVGVRIDLEAIDANFTVPVISRAKRHPREHGTEIVISRLERTRATWLSRNAPKLRETLGDVYSYLLTDRKFDLVVNGVKVKPRLRCAWGSNRSVVWGAGANAEVIPARIDIDEKFPADNCSKCGNWQVSGKEACDQCGGTVLENRVRRIVGWLGIQRHLHKSEYGVDFLRNGRKIVRFDKRIFEWQDPNDPLISKTVEYPVEVGPGGRLIGEIHIDHVPVNYQKNAFEWGDRSWIAVADYLRGTAPLLPKEAQRLGLPPNDSPLARLVKGYRRNDAGKRYLVPGNGTGPIHATTLQWKRLFDEGDPDYQGDQKWWDAVVEHDRIASAPAPSPAGPQSGPITPENVLGILNLPPSQPDAGAVLIAAEPDAVETEQERIDRYAAIGQPLPDLSRDYGLVELGKAAKVKALLITGTPVLDSSGARAPALVARQAGGFYYVFIDADHPLFRDFGDAYADLLVLEIAQQLRTRASSQLPLSEVVSRLKDKNLPDLKIDQPTLAGRAQALLREVRDRMMEAVRDNPERAWQLLTAEERAATETTLVVEDGQSRLGDLIASGEFIQYVPPLFLARVVSEWPEAFFDGRVFRGSFSKITSATGRAVSVARVVGYLYDVALLVVAQQSPPQLVRARVSLGLLGSELAS